MSAALAQAPVARCGPQISPRQMLRHLMVLRMARAAAEAGLSCPTNEEFADGLGCDDANYMPSLLRQMAERRLLRIELVGRFRVLVAMDGSWRTAPRATWVVPKEPEPVAPRLCARCEKPFQPATRFIIRCDPCREACAQVAL